MLLEPCFSFYLLALLFPTQLHSHILPYQARRSLSFPDMYPHNRKSRRIFALTGLGHYLIDVAWIITVVRQVIVHSMVSLWFVLFPFG